MAVHEHPSLLHLVHVRIPRRAMAKAFGYVRDAGNSILCTEPRIFALLKSNPNHTGGAAPSLSGESPASHGDDRGDPTSLLRDSPLSTTHACSTVSDQHVSTPYSVLPHQHDTLAYT